MHITLPLASVLVFLITLMFLLGLRVTLPEIGESLNDYPLVARSLLANLVLIPAAAVAVTTLVHLPVDIAVGILLMAAAPGVPFLPRMVAAAKGNMAFAIGLMILLQVASVVTTPVTFNLLLPVDAAVRVPVLRVIVTLILFQLLPLGLGMLVRSVRPAVAAALEKPVTLLSTLGLIGTLVLFIGPHLDVVAKVFGGGALAIILLLVVIAWPIGWVLGGPDVSTRKTLALGTSLRNVGLCLLVATQDFPESGVTATVGSYLLIQAIANFAFAKYVSRAPKPGVAGAPARPL